MSKKQLKKHEQTRLKGRGKRHNRSGEMPRRGPGRTTRSKR